MSRSLRNKQPQFQDWVQDTLGTWDSSPNLGIYVSPTDKAPLTLSFDLPDEGTMGLSLSLNI